MISRAALFLVAVACLQNADARNPVNDLKAPESRKDLEAIQQALGAALPQARAATVCIEIGEGSGSGVIVSADGLVLTAAHVAMIPNKGVTVVMEDGRKFKAKTLGLVAGSDAAMLKISDPGEYPFVEIGRENPAKLGDWVFSLGHSGGFDKARGVVVRSGRIVRIAARTVQTDCVLIGGDSGGPLFDLDGKLIGIHSRVGAELQANNHVPMSEYTANWEKMLGGEFIGEGPFAAKPEKGRGFMGFASEAASGGGLKVTELGEKSPAEAAGLKPGDIVRKLNGKSVSKREELQAIVRDLAAGEEVSLEIERAGTPETLTFNLGER